MIHNTKQVNPAEFKSFWDLLNPKWKGKIASLDPTSFGMGATLQFFYYQPELGAPFLKKLYGEMQIVVSRDPRQMTDWLSTGKLPLCIRCNANAEVEKAIQQKLPIAYLDTENWKEGGSSSAAGGTLGILTARPIPTRRRFSSTGCFPAKVKWRCRSSAVQTRTTRGVSTFPKTTSIRTIAWSKGRNISIWPSRSTKI